MYLTLVDIIGFYLYHLDENASSRSIKCKENYNSIIRRIRMKSSRAMLLVAMLFAAPVLADVTTETNSAQIQAKAAEVKAAAEAKTKELEAAAKLEAEKAKAAIAELQEDAKEKITEIKKEIAPTWTQKKLAAISAGACATADFVSAPVALTLNQFTRISYLKGGKFENSIPTVSKMITAAALVLIIKKGYDAYYADADDMDNDAEIFGDNN